MEEAQKLTICDKCLSKIENGQCDCGVWIDDFRKVPYMKRLEIVIEDFNKSGLSLHTVDHFSGSCIAFFKGSYDDCMKVREYIQNLQDK